MNQVNLAGGWNTLWGALSTVIGGPVMTLLTVIGVILVIGSIATYFFQKRRGGGAMQGLGVVMWSLVCGALLAAPQAIIPLALTLLDFVINGLLAVGVAVGF